MWPRANDKEKVNSDEQRNASGTEQPVQRPRNGASLSEAEDRRRDAARAERQSIESMRAFGALGSVGLSFVISIVIGAGGGLLIDRWTGAGHWGFFVGFFLGVAAAIVGLVRASKSIK